VFDSRSGRLLPAIAAPVLFGMGVAASKPILNRVDPAMAAGLLYLGSGIGLGILSLSRLILSPSAKEAPLAKTDWPWLCGALIMGGMLAPVLLMIGLAVAPANSAALLLNLETPLTVLLACLVFHEPLGRRSGLGIALVVLGGAALTWTGRLSAGFPWGGLAVAGACLAWALDNNLSQRICAKDPVQIAAVKGLAAGACNVALAASFGARMPAAGDAALLGLIGLLGYGLSLCCFLISLRLIGTARTGAFFALAPFIGAGAGCLFLHEPLTAGLVSAAALMGLGVGLSLGERHEHEHGHFGTHEHRHAHDTHHQHRHEPPDASGAEHSHPHSHEGLAHSHSHYPDIHHRQAH